MPSTGWRSHKRRQDIKGRGGKFFFFQKFELAMNIDNIPGAQPAIQREGRGGEETKGDKISKEEGGRGGKFLFSKI